MASPNAPLILHPDRLLPTDPAVRPVARRLYDAVRDLPDEAARHVLALLDADLGADGALVEALAGAVGER